VPAVTAEAVGMNKELFPQDRVIQNVANWLGLV